MGNRGEDWRDTLFKIKSVQDAEHGKELIIQERKTGSRRIPLISSVPAISKWLNDHPRNDEKEAPLFVSLRGKTKGKELSYRRLSTMLKKTAERAGVDTMSQI